MLVDSHCHLNFAEFDDNLNYYLDEMKKNQVFYALCVGTNYESFKRVLEIAQSNRNIFASIGIHPEEKVDNLTAEDLLQYTNNPKVIAIGETGLDYCKELDNSYQISQFIVHIEVAKKLKLPLIVHTRQSIDDTLSIMRENNATSCGAVMHCFTENIESARKCLDQGFYISISGIVTFKNAAIIKDVAKFLPLDRILIETDSPFLAPVPFRGKQNHPALLKYTAEYIANLKGIDVNILATHITNNFFNLFTKATR